MPHPAQLPSLILIVRHGATEWSVAGRHTGRTDLPLTELGVLQAHAAAPLLESLLVGTEPMVYASPLRRAADTAALALPAVEAQPTPSLMEYDYGDYEGLTSTQILQRDPQWDLFGVGCPGGEAAHEVTHRCDQFVAEMLAEAPGRAVVAFTHGHLGRILTARLLGLPTTAAGSLWNDTATIGVINEHRGKLVLVGWNLRGE